MNQLNAYDPATAAALRVVLHADIAPKNYRADATGDETPTWFIRSHVPQASKLLNQRKIGMLPDDSPFLAALLAADTAERIGEWLKAPPAAPPFAIKGKFLTTDSAATLPLGIPAECMLIPLLSPRAMGQIERDCITATLSAKTPFPALPLHIAAAAITCGCVPIKISGTAQQPFLHLTEESVTMPGLRLTDMVKAASNDLDAANALPGYPVGEHPFLYALEAVRTAALYRHVMEQARRNTTHMFRAKTARQRTAVVSESLLAGKRGGSFRDHLRNHLAGV
jgi:hypothetical protein